MRTLFFRGAAAWAIVAALLPAAPGARLSAQQAGDRGTSTASPLSLTEARRRALDVSPDIAAAREAVRAAEARARQAGAYPNPVLSVQREHTTGDGNILAQNIASVDQTLEIGGARGARIEVARRRHDAAVARLAAVTAQVEYDVTRAYAAVTAADRRAALAEQATMAFSRAGAVSATRLASGDVSGYAHRRIQLEAARYAGASAEAALARRAARLTLATLIASSPSAIDSLRDVTITELEPIAALPATVTSDSLVRLASRHRAELRLAQSEAGVASAESQLAQRERVPLPTLTAGYKDERVADGVSLSGYVAGISIPLPLWDRRSGAVEAADAESRRRVLEVEAVRRRVRREIEDATTGLRAAEEQMALLHPHLGPESESALRAAQVAYSEGEISLVEWLDAVRAYQEAETSFATLRAEVLIRRAALERAVGTQLWRELP
jgi:cobalt-zinc-cadmium efflux system outer membrane protein